MKTRKLRIKRKIVVKSRKKGKLNRKISNRRKQRKSMVRRRTRQNKYRRHNLKKIFSRKMRGGVVNTETRQFSKSSSWLGWKNATFTVSYNDALETMTITWKSKNHPDGFTINFNEEAIIVNGNTVYAVRNDNGDRQKIVQLYSNEIANEFKTFLDSFVKKNKDRTTGEVKITADVLITAINIILNDMSLYEQSKTNARSDETRSLFIQTASNLPLYQNLTAPQNVAIKTEIINELSNHIGNAYRLVSNYSNFWVQRAWEMPLPDLLYYKWENDIYTKNSPMPLPRSLPMPLQI